MAESPDHYARLTDSRRLDTLSSTGLLDSAADERFDRFTRLARTALDVPISLVSLVDTDRQFLKSAHGLEGDWAGARATPLSHSMCRHVVADRDRLVVEDTVLDPRFAGGPVINDLGIRAYLGYPIRLEGEVLGSFCVLDRQPRHWSARDIEVVRDLAALVEAEIEARLANRRARVAATEAGLQREQMATLLDALGDGVYAVDADGRCTEINRAALEMFGYSRDEVLGRDMHALIHHTRPNGAPYPSCECPMLPAHGSVVRLENEVLWRRDGTPVSAEYSSYPVRVGGTLAGSVLTVNDTSLRQDAHKRLSVHFAVSRALTAAADERSILGETLAAVGAGLGWDVGAFWAVDAANTQLTCRATWSSPSVHAEEFIAATDGACFLPGQGLPGRVWATGEPLIVQDVLTDQRFTRYAGAAASGLHTAFAFPAMAGTEVRGVIELYRRACLPDSPALLQSVATLGGLLGQFLKRRQTEQELMLSRRAIDAASTGVAISDARTETMPLIYCNPAFETITGYPVAEALGRNCRFLQGPDTDPAVIEEIRAALREHRDCSVVVLNYKRDGTPFWNALTVSPVFNGDGVLTHYVGVQTDVTERREAEEALAAAKLAAEDANQAKSQFIANMSHELRTPISAVIGYTELLEEEVADLEAEGTETVLDDIRKIRGSARHLLDLINEVLDLSKIEAGKMELQLEDFSLGTLLEEVAETVQALMAKKANQLVVDAPPEALGAMHSDPVKLRQCLYNLLSNAAKFTENGQITLAVRRGAPDPAGGAEILEFRVTDTGIGMSGEQIDRLFRRFTQADNSTTRRFGGTGLGLALTKTFCEMMGGGIAVHSVPGQGTTFSIRLPASLRPAATAPAPTPGAAATEGDGETVLVIDDDAPTRDLLTRFLAREGLRARSAADGEEGLRLARALRPSAILLDVMMPRLDGWAVLSALKADPDLCDIPVIMVSVVQERGLAYSLGAADYVTKPVDWQRLKRTIERHRAQGDPRRALLIEHDRGVRAELRRMLEEEGWSVLEAESGEQALHRLQAARPDLILLDLQAPEPGGFTFLGALRGRADWQSIPVIALTERSVTAGERERLKGQVRRIVQAQEGEVTQLAEELRRIGVVRAGPAASPETTSHG